MQRNATFFKGKVMHVASPIAHPAALAAKRAEACQFPCLVQELTELVGARFTAYIASATDGRLITQWATGESEPSELVKRRLHLAYRVAKTIALRFDSETSQAWLQGSNPELGDRVPLVFIREQDPCDVEAEILTAVDRFVER